MKASNISELWRFTAKLKDTPSGWIRADMRSDNPVSYNWRSCHVAPRDGFNINAIDLFITGILYVYYSEQTMTEGNTEVITMIMIIADGK